MKRRSSAVLKEGTKVLVPAVLQSDPYDCNCGLDHQIVVVQFANDVCMTVPVDQITGMLP